MDNIKDIISRSRLLMEYDLAKTYDENKELITENRDGSLTNPLTGDDMTKDVNKVVDLLDGTMGDDRGGLWRGIVTGGVGITTRRGMIEIMTILQKYQYKYAQKDGRPEDVVPAIQVFSDRYADEERGDTLYGDIKGIGNVTWSDEARRAQRVCLDLVQAANAAKPQKRTTSTERQNNINYNYCNQQNGMITANSSFKNTPWEDYRKKYDVTPDEIETAKKSCGGQGPTPPVDPGPNQSYPPCKPNEYKQGCSSSKVEEVQRCFYTLRADGKFGPRTQSALAAIGYSNGFTDADIQTICSKAPKRPQTTNTNKKTTTKKTTTKKTDQFYDVEDGSQEITIDDLP